MKKIPLLLNQDLGKRDFSKEKVDLDFKKNYMKIFGNSDPTFIPKKKILIFSSLDDAEINILGPIFIKNEIDYLRVNSENFEDDFEFSIEIRNDEGNALVKAVFFGEEYLINDFDYIWIRHFSEETFGYKKNINKTTKDYLVAEWGEFFSALKEIFPEKLLIPKSSHISKPKQLIEAKNVGLKIPNTIITNSRKELVSFFKNYDGKIFAKALKHHSLTNSDGSLTDFYGRSFYSLEKLLEEDVESAPVIFQEQINKTDSVEYRVNIFGESISSFIYHNIVHDDWHFEDITGLTLEEKSIPLDIKKRILELFKNLDLRMGTLDIISYQDDWYFLEINVGGDWRWLENTAKVDLSQHVINMFI